MVPVTHRNRIPDESTVQKAEEMMKKVRDGETVSQEEADADASAAAATATDTQSATAETTDTAAQNATDTQAADNGAAQ